MPAANPTGDRRLVLADWMTAPDNPYFARNLANRVWACLLGRGLVEPVDDVRATNPPTTPSCSTRWRSIVVENKYDVRKLIVLITASRDLPDLDDAERDQREGRAELLAGLLQAAGRRGAARHGLPGDWACRRSSPGSPGITRAVQLWDSKARSDFLKLFGRPNRVSACECERTREPCVSQVLNLLNSPDIQAKLTHEAGTVARLVRAQKDDAKLVEELYLTFYRALPHGQGDATSA